MRHCCAQCVHAPRSGALQCVDPLMSSWPQDFWSPRGTTHGDVESRLATTQAQLALVLCSHLELLTTVTSQASEAILFIQQRGSTRHSQTGASLRLSKSNSNLHVCSSSASLVSRSDEMARAGLAPPRLPPGLPAPPRQLSAPTCDLPEWDDDFVGLPGLAKSGTGLMSSQRMELQHRKADTFDRVHASAVQREGGEAPPRQRRASAGCDRDGRTLPSFLERHVPPGCELPMEALAHLGFADAGRRQRASDGSPYPLTLTSGDGQHFEAPDSGSATPTSGAALSELSDLSSALLEDVMSASSVAIAAAVEDLGERLRASGERIDALESENVAVVIEEQALIAQVQQLRDQKDGLERRLARLTARSGGGGGMPLLRLGAINGGGSGSGALTPRSECGTARSGIGRMRMAASSGAGISAPSLGGSAASEAGEGGALGRARARIKSLKQQLDVASRGRMDAEDAKKATAERASELARSVARERAAHEKLQAEVASLQLQCLRAQ
jgi:hypothetical protein